MTRSEKSFQTLRYKWLGLTVRLAIAIQLRRMRKGRGWTRAETAQRAGVGMTTLFMLECGLFGSLNTLVKLANAFDVAFIARFTPWSEGIKESCEAMVGPLPIPFDADDALLDPDVSPSGARTT